ncbi:MAG: translation initiation factor IF-3 [Clostridiaceae bacterium]|nr:translation initiation factor IF-3 [Clostridiaceae bacterium]
MGRIGDLSIFFEEVMNIARKNSQTQVNEKIRFKEVRLIDENGEMVGIVPTNEAIERAKYVGLDLVLMSANPKNPVAKIIDYGKYAFEQSKREKEARKKQKVIEVKEVGLKLTTEEHDLNVKLKNARRFLAAGNRVKVSIRFRGREMAYTSQGYDVMENFLEKLSDVAEVDRKPKVEGRNMNMYLSPLKEKTSKK